MILAMMSLLFTGAIFGFFYAWVCSTMWGLDQLAPQAAIAAMQAMNASVRNVVFFPAFFLTPMILLATALANWQTARAAALVFLIAAAVYSMGGLLLTLLVNVPMNDVLALVDPVAADSQKIWDEYSARWQFWNQVRTVASALALLLAGLGTWLLGAARSIGG